MGLAGGSGSGFWCVGVVQGFGGGSGSGFWCAALRTRGWAFTFLCVAVGQGLSDLGTDALQCSWGGCSSFGGRQAVAV